MAGQKNFIALEATSQEILGIVSQILPRVVKIDLVTSTVVTGNPYEIGFASISDLVVTGTWDANGKKVEF